MEEGIFATDTPAKMANLLAYIQHTFLNYFSYVFKYR